MIRLKRPKDSRVQIKYTLVSKSVQRKHPSHYVQEGDGTIFVHSNATGDTKRPKSVGSFHFWVVQTFQAFAAHVDFKQMLSDELAPIANLFSKVPGMNDQFREDLSIEPCNSLVVVDRFTINDSDFDHETLKQQCLEEFVRAFCYIEIIVVGPGVKLEPDTLKKMKFAKVFETEFFIRDNCSHFGGPIVEQSGISSDDYLRLIMGE